MVIAYVRTLSVTKRAEEVLAIESAPSRVFCHPLSLLKVYVASNFLELGKILHIFDQLIMRTIKASIDIDFVLMHVKWRLKGRGGIPLLSLAMIYIVIVYCQELYIQLLMQYIHVRPRHLNLRMCNSIYKALFIIQSSLMLPIWLLNRTPKPNNIYFEVSFSCRRQ